MDTHPESAQAAYLDAARACLRSAHNISVSARQSQARSNRLAEAIKIINHIFAEMQADETAMIESEDE